jgi:hypothetical protein
MSAGVLRARRLPVQDEVLENDQSVVMARDMVLLLSPLATRILALAGDGADVPDIASRLEKEFGPPGDDRQTLAFTLGALRELAGQHLVEVWQDQLGVRDSQ